MTQNDTRANGPEEVEARYLRTGDIIAIKGEPLVVDTVTPIKGSVSVTILFTNEFKHITFRTTKFKVLAVGALSDVVQAAISRDMNDAAQAMGNVALAGDPVLDNGFLEEEFNNLCADVARQTDADQLNEAIMRLGTWVYKFRGAVTFRVEIWRKARGANT